MKKATENERQAVSKAIDQIGCLKEACFVGGQGEEELEFIAKHLYSLFKKL